MNLPDSPDPSLACILRSWKTSVKLSSVVVLLRRQSSNGFSAPMTQDPVSPSQHGHGQYQPSIEVFPFQTFWISASPLVVYDEPLDRFRFAHLSVREFLESQPGYTTFEANRSAVERSLQTVTCHQPSGDPFWSYAILYWIFHFHRLEE